MTGILPKNQHGRCLIMGKNSELKGACVEALSILANALAEDTCTSEETYLHDEAKNTASKNKCSSNNLKYQTSAPTTGNKS